MIKNDLHRVRPMIKNDRQLSVTKARLGELSDRLARLERKYPDPKELEFYAEATKDQIEAMKRELRLYRLVKTASTEQLLRLWAKRGAVVPSKKGDISLGELLSMLRMAKGLTQEQLAKRLGLKQSHVARYEQRGYTGYTVETLSRIFRELGVKLSVEPLPHGKAA